MPNLRLGHCQSVHKMQESEGEPGDFLPENMFDEQCESAVDRQAVVDRLAKSVAVADSIAPNAWSATFFANGFRLNVGSVEVLTFVDREVTVNLSAALGTDPFCGGSYLGREYRTCQKFCVQGSFQERDPVKRSPYKMAN
jgi:hypothetical protein